MYSSITGPMFPNLWLSTRLGRRAQAFKEDIDRPLAAILTLNTIAHTVGAIGVGDQGSKIWQILLYADHGVGGACGHDTSNLGVVRADSQDLWGRNYCAAAGAASRLGRWPGWIWLLGSPWCGLANGSLANWKKKGSWQRFQSQRPCRAWRILVPSMEFFEEQESEIISTRLKFRSQ